MKPNRNREQQSQILQTWQIFFLPFVTALSEGYKTVILLQFLSIICFLNGCWDGTDVAFKCASFSVTLHGQTQYQDRQFQRVMSSASFQSTPVIYSNIYTAQLWVQCGHCWFQTSISRMQKFGSCLFTTLKQLRVLKWPPKKSTKWSTTIPRIRLFK